MALGLLAGVVLLVGCGKKTAPVPPESAVPAPVADLSGELDPEGITLRWSWPRKTEKGGSLRMVNDFTVERAEYPADGFCADCPQLYQPVATLPGGPLPERPEASALSYRDQKLRPGYHYSYRIRSSLGWRVVSRPSAPVSLVWQMPMAPPTDLTARSGERQISLNWLPPTVDREGVAVAEPLLFQVQRSEGDQPFRLVSGNLSTPAFTDQEIRSGVGYQYRVRAARLSGGTGVFSGPLTVGAVDLTPPPVPFGLALVITRGSVRLFWEPMSGVDLGGVMIYRRRELPTGSGDYELIGRVEGRTTTYVDPLPLQETDEVRSYALKSYDLAEPPNLSEYSRAAQTPDKASQP